MSTLFNREFLEAAEEYQWMLSRGYPQPSALKLVGDRFMLTRDLRQILYRGVSSEEKAAGRNQKLGVLKKKDKVLIDGYNVLFTLTNYLLGRPVFISNDGILRDAGEMRGRIPDKEVFERAKAILLEALTHWLEMTFTIYLDEPVSYSGKLASDLESGMQHRGLRGDAKTVRSPDQELLSEKSDAICTSDTVIIDHYQGRLFDLSRFILEENFQPNFPSLVQ